MCSLSGEATGEQVDYRLADVVGVREKEGGCIWGMGMLSEATQGKIQLSLKKSGGNSVLASGKGV